MRRFANVLLLGWITVVYGSQYDQADQVTSLLNSLPVSESATARVYQCNVELPSGKVDKRAVCVTYLTPNNVVGNEYSVVK